MDPRYHRHTIRLFGYSYRQPGAYMVTICSHQMRHTLARVVAGYMTPTFVGTIAARAWNELPDHFPNIRIDAFVVMPHHVHGIVIIREWSGDHPAPGLDRRRVLPGSLGAIVRSFKSAVTRGVHLRDPEYGPVWQRNYWERVMADSRALEIAQRYITNNPAVWIRRYGDGRGSMGAGGARRGVPG